jgi:F0F1-type ATP synthase membrane subunit b/b'
MEAIMPNYTVFIQAIVFFISLYLIKKLILDPSLRVLKGRNDRIEGAEQETTRLQKESTALDEQYKGKIREARAKAQSERARRKQDALAEERKILEKGREEANQQLKQIGAEIQKESLQAKARLGEVARELSRIFAEKLLGRSVS